MGFGGAVPAPRLANVGRTKAFRREGAMKRASVACVRLPPLKFVMLTVLITMIVMTAIMLPTYFAYINSTEGQGTSVVWPEGLTKEEALNETSADRVVLELEVQTINPELHVITMLLAVQFHGAYRQWSELGALQLPGYDAGDGNDKNTSSLVVTVADQQAVVFQYGQALPLQTIAYLIKPKKRVYFYPNDIQTIEMELRATVVVPGLPNVYLPVAIVYNRFRLGWQLTEVFEHLPGLPPEYGARIVVSMQRSDSVKFCAILIVIVMWAISLAIFCLSLNFVLFPTPADEQPSYEVPALAVGLLFALPFVRTVIPDVPSVGIAADVLGFFWNIILIALCTILTMVAALRTYTKHQEFVAADSRMSGLPDLLPDNFSVLGGPPGIKSTTGDRASGGEMQSRTTPNPTNPVAGGSGHGWGSIGRAEPGGIGASAVELSVGARQREQGEVEQA